ncbi:bifunctional proline dehydrogenase/L-glutamate gamma-semialdehyde dehydrogenase PutA [Paracoccus aerodenitrificans]|uniref:bifunctional proline dehydrogenase/L-glutamate gamma-semialdehyde dehydrogenase PutA n=1 Tax=Paracoccus aerodenitrificans TaxID=3017781 RepID=UPI0022F0ADBB|nr:bifunctional proline dehydrogenase/L-glutamate gamma-semialdehyde dehydrogenase PutA [Paracoccus aerodenitrificans]WBU63883.1 bifunctional proline dehydrogenase/L-glutamate gamma-semialdehyde dehydrogenase PutA [Paracoccus aerodenitrificans]
MNAPDLTAFTPEAKFRPVDELLPELIGIAALSEDDRSRISARAADLVRRIRAEDKPTLMEHFLSEYGLSTREGIALMCLAEAMLRVPDKITMDALIEDKIAPSDWGKHLGEASSSLVNASTWALMLTGKVLDDDQPGVVGTLRGAIKRLGEPVIRTAVNRAMREMGKQFVLGQTIAEALKNAAEQEKQGYSYSYDMLGEAAMTRADADRYAKAYADAIRSIAKSCDKASIRENPGISIKLSALHPRYEVAHEDRAIADLVPVVLDLARAAKAANMGMNIDAEEQDRLVLSMKIIEAVLSDPSLAGWDGFGVVVQAYGKRAGMVIDWLHGLAEKLDRRIMVRLVKGAYWDTEMKHAQVLGLPGFTLFTRKVETDVSYIANARKLIGYADRIYPQFATHNAHTVAAILEMVGDIDYEFQRLHGMGERLHEIILKEAGNRRCRIYAPVGAHRDLLAYLVRRLLENGANSSFVHQIVDEDVPPEEIAQDPFAQLATAAPPALLERPENIFGPERRNSRGFDLTDETTLTRIRIAAPAQLADAAPITVSEPSGTARPVRNPATGETVAQVTEADADTAAHAIADAAPWNATAAERAGILRRAADLYEENFGEIFSTLHLEAGKSLPDAVSELREAVDFLRYYALQGENRDDAPRGIFTAISPWNFPLAIFTGQIAAAMMGGNAVLAKPAEQTPLIAAVATRLLHKAGVPVHALQLLPGDGGTVGAALTSDARINGVVFTGSTDTAKIIAKAMAENLAPGTPLIAETGGLNAMIVDSTALPEQAVRDIVASSFQSAGQRCSALRCLYVQEDVAPQMIEMLKGAMDQLGIGDPRDLSTDVGPVIDAEAQADISGYIDAQSGNLLHKLAVPAQGSFVPPTLLKVNGIDDLEREVFGPVLHLATFKNRDLEKVIAAVNARGFGLTFGLHTRIDSRVQEIADAVHAGNIYVNRNQIGAIVGSQPFGGEGLSGTGPKAGGPNYLPRFYAPASPSAKPGGFGGKADIKALQKSLADALERDISETIMPGPTGELNRLTTVTRPPLLCLGPGKQAVAAQVQAIEALGSHAVAVNGDLAPDALTTLDGFSAAIWWGNEDQARAYAQALASRHGEIKALITTLPDLAHIAHERHLCVDTTAAGGNAALLAG